MKVSVADDVFVLGFPYGQTAGIHNLMPVWKRATIATQPDKNFYDDGRDTFLIDTTTRSGMSGAPVFARSNGQCFTENGDISIDGQAHFKFLGVYSSRIDGDKRDDSFLGLVWKRNLIDEIIDGGNFEDNPPPIS